MKVCAIICEFNPFHNGHAYLLEQARIRSGCDAVFCIMSGSFTQRGEIAAFDKYERARWAVLGGADIVAELPTAFSVAPAEVFATGAIKILKNVPCIDCIAFGCENADFDFSGAAKTLCFEDEKFKDEISRSLANGDGYIKSYVNAAKSVLGDVFTPNNILGLEYAKAAFRANFNARLLPIERRGHAYDDKNLCENFSSASAIRENVFSPLARRNVPPYVSFDGLSNFKEFKRAAHFALFTEDCENLKAVIGCGEGLENRLKKLCFLPYDEIVEKSTNKRYSSSRIRRILCSNLLKIKKSDVDLFLDESLYIKVLAVKKENKRILAELARSPYPVCTDGVNSLSGAAKKCFESDKYAYSLFCFINGVSTEKKGYDYMLIVE